MRGLFFVDYEMMDLKEKLRELGIKSGEPFAIAVSGGCDSMALCLLCRNSGLDFTAIIVDHKYRRNSTKEANDVSKYLAKELAIEAKVLTNKKTIPKTGVEEFMREVRYELIFNYLKKNKIKKLLMAHHLDDQVETFLMRLERGAGLDGLTGIKQVSELTINCYKVEIIRPLLGSTKEELKEILNKNKIKWWEDPSNENIEITRNNIRKTLSGFSDYGLLRKRISTVIDNIERAKHFIESEKERHFKIVFKTSKAGACLDITKYKKLHPELRLRILRDIIKKHSKTRKDVRLGSIKTLDSKLTDKGFKVAELHGITIKNDNKSTVIFK